MIKERKEREERQTKILNTMKAVQKSSRTHVFMKLISVIVTLINCIIALVYLILF
jgi:hypothetical protein